MGAPLAMSLPLLLCCALSLAASGTRVAPVPGLGVRYIEPVDGAPKLEVLRTSDVAEAAEFLAEWSSARDFGMFAKFAPHTEAFAPRRVVLLGICRYTRVLLLDLRPFLGDAPQPMPAQLAEFLEDERRTFYGMGLMKAAAHLAFEFDLVIRCIDFRVRAWRQLSLGGGLYGVANRYLETSFARPPTLARPQGQAVHAWLQWALASYFMMFFGPPSEDWVVTRAELFGAGPMYLRVHEPKHDWSEAMEDWMRRQRDRLLEEDSGDEEEEESWETQPAGSPQATARIADGE